MAPAALLPGISGFSDLTITCGDRQWHAHKGVLCVQSEYFAKACEGGFKEGQEDVIDLREDDPSVVEAMLKYLYTGTYSEDPTELGGMCPAVFNVRVSVLGEKYLIDDLLTVAAGKFTNAARQAWDTDSFTTAITEVSQKTADRDNLLRDGIVDVVMDNTTTLLGPGEVGSRFKTMLSQTPAVAADIAQALAKDRDDLSAYRIYRCPNSPCSGLFKSKAKAGDWIQRICTRCNTPNSAAFSGWQLHVADIPTTEASTPF